MFANGLEVIDQHSFRRPILLRGGKLTSKIRADLSEVHKNTEHRELLGTEYCITCISREPCRKYSISQKSYFSREVFYSSKNGIISEVGIITVQNFKSNSKSDSKMDILQTYERNSLKNNDF